MNLIMKQLPTNNKANRMVFRLALMKLFNSFD